MQMSELMMSLPHNFPFILFTAMTKIPYFSYDKVKLALYPLWISAEYCLLNFALIYFDMGTCSYMFEQKNIKKIKTFIYKNYGKGEAMKSHHWLTQRQRSALCNPKRHRHSIIKKWKIHIPTDSKTKEVEVSKWSYSNSFPFLYHVRYHHSKKRHYVAYVLIWRFLQCS